MAQVAYDLEHFAPQPRRQAPRVRVVEGGRGINARRVQVLRMVRTLLGVMVLVALMCGVLYTQTRVTELQSQITEQESELVEQEALYAYLSFELDNKTSLKNVEERAESLGLEKISNGQVTYFRTEEGDEITVKNSGIAEVLANTKNSLLDIIHALIP